MLCITLRRGDYFTIGDNIVVQLEHFSNERVHLTIDAPRETVILRGQVLERSGKKRPDCVYDK